MITVIYETVQFLMVMIDSPEKEKRKKSLKSGKGDKNILLHTITPKIEIILSKLDGV